MVFEITRYVDMHFSGYDEKFGEDIIAEDINDVISSITSDGGINQYEFSNIDKLNNSANFKIINRGRYEGDYFSINKITMDFKEYDERARATAIYPDHLKVTYPSMGLCGEAGEVIDKIKKVHRDKHSLFSPEIRHEIAKEIGDVLWYCSLLARDLGYSLEIVAEMNIDKLESRRERGVIGGNGDNR